MLIGVMRIFLFSDHLNEVGMIKNGDGSLQDCHKALIHYDKLLVKQKFVVEGGIHLKKTLMGWQAGTRSAIFWPLVLSITDVTLI